MIDQYYQIVLDNSPECIVLIDKNHKVLAFNSTMQRILNEYHHKEIKVGDLYYPNFVIESNRKLYLEAFRSAINGKPFFVQNLTKNVNTSYWFEYEMRPVNNGNLLGVTLSARNITKEKEAESKIIELSKNFKAILDNTNESIILLDTNFKVLALNKVSESRIKYNTQSESFLGQDFRDLIPDKSNFFYEYYPKALKGESALVEISYQNTLGELLWYQTKFNPVYDDQALLIGVSMFAKDITKQKILEFSLVESEKRFHRITELTPIGIIITNENFEISYANKCAKDIFEYNDDEFLGLSLIHLIENFSEGRNNKLKIDSLDFDIDSPLFIQEKFTLVTKNKTNRSALVSSAAFLNNEKNSQNYIFTIEDISHINQKETIIEEQTSRLRDIAWHQSHIVRAPLARIMGLISLYADNLLDENEKKYFHEKILQSARELDKVIHDIVNKTSEG